MKKFYNLRARSHFIIDIQYMFKEYLLLNLCLDISPVSINFFKLYLFILIFYVLLSSLLSQMLNQISYQL